MYVLYMLECLKCDMVLGFICGVPFPLGELPERGQSLTSNSL